MSERRHEMSSGTVTRDTRSLSDRWSYWLFQPSHFITVLVGVGVICVLTPPLWPLWTLLAVMLWIVLADWRFRLPLRMPKDLGVSDPSDVMETEIEEAAWFGLYRRRAIRRAVQKANGILYLGKQRGPISDPWAGGQELWATSSDACTHMSLAATTGGGKTQALLGLSFNALCWGSGLIFADGKAMSDVAYNMWCMARSFGREDDVLFLSFLTGGRDPFEQLADNPGKGPRVYRPFQSNSMQPFADGEASFILQLLGSLLPKASGDGAQWQTKALNMADAVIRILCYKRAMGEADTSVPTIRQTFALENLVKFYIEGREGKLPELAFLPIKAYFETGLPGFVPGLADQPDQWSPEVRNQHGYLTGQFARMLAMMTDSYGYVFGDRFGEIDMSDVLLNNRVLVALVPSMEKSPEEAAALGKLLLSAIRLMMAQNLGHQLEGKRQEVIDVKATNTAFPTPIITDELGYYFAPGMAVMYAQARSLKFFMVAAFQDLQALKRGEGSDEVASLIANTKFKYCMALEDPEATFDLFRKAGGQSAVSVVSGYESGDGLLVSSWNSQQTTRIEMRDRIELQELKKLDPGQGLMIFKDQVVRTSAFHLPESRVTSTVVRASINRFLQVPPPAYARLPGEAVASEKQARTVRQAEREIAGALFKGQAPTYPLLDDPILDAVTTAAKHMNALSHQHFTATERGVVLYEAARQALRDARAAGREAFWHAAIAAAPLDESDDFEVLEY